MAGILVLRSLRHRLFSANRELISKQKVKLPRLSSSSDPTDSDPRIQQGPASGVTNPDCSTVALDGRPDVKEIDWDRICLLHSQDFTKIQKTILFADKTEFIFNVFHAGTHALHLFAPKRFGKSTFLDAIRSCMSIQLDVKGEAIDEKKRKNSDIYKLFMNLELGKKHPEFVEQNCGQYPVIHVSFEDVRGNDEKTIHESLTSAVCKAFEPHEYLIKRDNDKEWVWRNSNLRETVQEVEIFLNYLLKSRRNKLNIDDVTEGLIYLAKLLHIHHGQKVVLLLDECDTPVMRCVKNGKGHEIVKKMIELVGSTLKTTLKGIEVYNHIKRAVLTSCVRMPGVYTWDANNIKEYYFMRDSIFSKLFGFTKEEVSKMMLDPQLKLICDKAQINQFDAITNMDAINYWYDGYRVLEDENVSIYCSNSLLNYTIDSIMSKKPKLAAYWAGGGYLTTLAKLFRNDSIRNIIQKLLDGGTYNIRVTKVTQENILDLTDTMTTRRPPDQNQIHFFFQLLSEDGILNTIEENEGIATLVVPNHEIKTMIERHCYSVDLFKDLYRIKPKDMEEYISKLKYLLRNPGKEACKEFANAVSKLYSYEAQIPANETEFNARLYNLAANHMDIEAQSNRPAVTEKEPEWQQRSKRGRKKEFDILITFGTAGVIFELKYDAQSAQEALQQIYRKEYFKALDKKEHAGVKRKMYVGLHMNKEKKVTICAWLNGLTGEMVEVASDD